MNYFRKTLGALLAVIIALGALAAAPVSASAKSTLKGTVYEYNDYGLKYSYDLKTMELTIAPGDIRECDDLASGLYSFIDKLRNKIKKLTIKPGVKTIDELSNITSLESVEIPDTVKTIEDHAFKKCTNLKNISIDGVERVGRNVLSKTAIYNDFMNSDDEVLYVGTCLIKAKPSLSGRYIVKEGTTSIADGAFMGCKSLTAISIPDSVTIIASSVFEGCSALSDIELGENMKSIERDAFKDTAFYSQNRENSALYLGKYLIDVERDEEGKPQDFEIKEGTTLIADYAFEFFNLTSVKIPDSVRIIGDYAFWSNDDLKELVLPEGVEEIGNRAFYECGITSVVFPSTLKKIGFRAFSYCESLDRIYINDISAWCGIEMKERLYEKQFHEYDEDDVTSPFYNASELYIGGKLVTDLKIPEGVESIGDYTFAYCKAIDSVKIPDSVKYIGKGAFYASGIEKITMGSDVENIGKYAFTNTYCLDGDSYRKGDGVYFGKYLIDATLYKVTYTKKNKKIITENNNITKFTVKKGTIGIAEGAFEHCGNIVNVKLPKSLKYISDRAFVECSSLKKIEIPSSVVKIGSCSVGMKEVIENVDDDDWVLGYVVNQDCAVYGEKGSVAEKYAKEYGVVFNKIANPLKASAKKVTITLKSLKKGKVTVKPITVKGAKGAVSFKTSGIGYDPDLYGKYTVNKKSGAITIKKGSYKKGTHEFYIAVKAKGGKGYAPKTIDVSVSVKLK